MAITTCEIDLAAIRENLAAFRAHVGRSVALMLVVKANAYGHGAERVAQTVEKAGADWLAVNRAEEGVKLREAGIHLPILILGYSLLDDVRMIVQHDLTPTVTELAQARAYADWGESRGRDYPVHIKVDTGMGRLGLLPDEAPAFIQTLAALDGLQIEGIFTHFAVADSTEPEHRAYTRQQLAALLGVREAIQQSGLANPLFHAANSAGTLYYPESHLEMVRIGVSLYGMPPNAQQASPIPLRPALTLKSRVGRVRTLPAGASISYGRTYQTAAPLPVALVPVGYGDGYHRLNSNRGAVLIGGERAPIVGRVCMDQVVVDISACGSVEVEDEVVLIGRQGEAEITADEVAKWAETINYEVTTGLLPRAERIFKNP